MAPPQAPRPVDAAKSGVTAPSEVSEVQPCG